MGVDAFVIRHKSSGVPWQVSRWTTASVINAGDGWHAHPTQALLDAYTIRTALGRTGGFDGLRIAIVGDIKPQPGRPQRRRGRSRCSAPTSRSSPRATLLPPVPPAPATDDLDDGDREGRRAVPVADAAGADDRGAGAEPARVQRPLRAHARAGRAGCPSTRW